MSENPINQRGASSGSWTATRPKSSGPPPLRNGRRSYARESEAFGSIKLRFILSVSNGSYSYAFHSLRELGQRLSGFERRPEGTASRFQPTFVTREPGHSSLK